MKKIVFLSSILGKILLGFSLNSTSNIKIPIDTVSGSNNISKGIYWLKGNNKPFDTFDLGFMNFFKKNISTKIVEKPFGLILVKNPKNYFVIPSNQGFDINVSVYDMNTNKIISNTIQFYAIKSSITFPNVFKSEFDVKSASKNAKIGFLICADYENQKYTSYPNQYTIASYGNRYFTNFDSGYNKTTSNKIYILYPYSECSNKIYPCDYQGKGLRICYSSDNFSVRPYKFKIQKSLYKKVAGKDFNITIEALNYKGEATKNYNEMLHLNKKTTVYLEYKDTNASKGCLTGKLYGQMAKFKNGIANIILNYSEIGDLNLTVKEINGSEFAKVDNKDTSWKNRRIPESSEIIKFIPDHFYISANYKNFDNSEFTYISNNLKMSSVLDVNITAKNKENETTKNYNSKCYAKNFNVGILYGKVPSKINKLLLNDGKEDINITIPNPISLYFDKNYFSTENNGTAKLNFKINFKRSPRTPVKEFNFTIKDINISDNNGVKGKKNLDKNSTFKYGRIDISNVGSFGNEINTTYTYEYWTKNGWKQNKEHNGAVFGDVYENKSLHPFVTIKINHNIKKSKENVELSTNNELSYDTNIHLSISSWLWYNPLAITYKDPSVNNKDCLTHPCENVMFDKIGTGWGGIGKNNVSWSETNRTIKINFSLKKFKLNKEETQKLNW